jgi:hypothetical protein
VSTADFIHDELQTLRNCALTILVGEKLGRGATRTVYALKHDPSLVVKLEYAARQFCNVVEYDIWRTVSGHKNARWFAPVIDIDVWGGALIMKRTQPITKAEFEAEVGEVPAFLGDTHWANFGRLDGQIVCHDYGYHPMLDALTRAPRMKKPRRES